MGLEAFIVHDQAGNRVLPRYGLLTLMGFVLAGCATTGVPTLSTGSGAARGSTSPSVDTVHAAGPGVGANPGVGPGLALTGEREADAILSRATLGGNTGAGAGPYMDRQQERLSDIPGTEVERTSSSTLLLHFRSDVLFPVNSASLSDSSKLALDRVAGVLGDYRRTAIVVQGHTDSSGTEDHNQRLSERRAQAVQRYLLGKGLDPNRMVAVGYGETEPLAGNDSHEGRRRNRRVDILLKAGAI
jgi:outer membrane protein OmpA-like peptidoglycan-associated protein